MASFHISDFQPYLGPTKIQYYCFSNHPCMEKSAEDLGSALAANKVRVESNRTPTGGKPEEGGPSNRREVRDQKEVQHPNTIGPVRTV